MKTLSLLLCTCFFYTLAIAQPGDLPPNPEPGKCYAKCLIPPSPHEPIYVEIEKEYPIYTGATPDQVKLKTVDIIIEPATTKWVKKGEGDRKVWCLVETPAIKETLTVLKNTKQTDDYEMRTITTRERIDSHISEGQTEWREVLCNEKISTKKVLKLQKALKAKGYYKAIATGTFDVETKSALVAYQKAQALPIGNLDIETLKNLSLAFR